MSGRFAIIGLTALAFLALGAGTVTAPGTASAEFRVPGLFTGKKVVKRRRYRRPAPVQPVRNPDRTFAAVSAKTVSPAVAKNSDAALSVGTASAASVMMALPAATRVAANTEATDEDAASTADTDVTADTEVAADTEQAADTDKTADTDETAPEADGTAVADESDAGDSESDPEAAAEAEAETDSADDGKTAAAEATPEDTDSASQEADADADEPEKASDTQMAADETSEAAADDAKADDTESPDSKTAKRDEDDEGADTKLADTSSNVDDDDAATSETAADTEQDADKPDAPVTADADAADDQTADNDGSGTDVAEAEAAEAKTADTKTAEAKTAVTDAADAKDEEAAEEETAAAEAAEEMAAEQKAEGKPQQKRADASEATETASADASSKPEDEADKDKIAEAADSAATATAGADERAERETAETDEPTKTADAAPNAASNKDADSEGAAAEQADAEDADTKATDAKTADAKAADADGTGATDADGKDTDNKDVAEKTEEPADKDETSEGEIVTASLPPAPEPKPEIARMASPANTPERLAETASDAQDEDASNESDVTASISPSSEEEGVASSVETADVTDVARATDGVPADDQIDLDPRPFDPRAYDDTVVLKVSPPPGSKPDGEGAKIAALEPGSTPVSGSDSASSDGEDEAVDLGPPPPPPVDPVIVAVRSKLDGSAPPKVAAADLEALQAIYEERDDKPLWVAEDGLTPEAKTLIVTISDAGDWGLDPDAYALPASDTALTTDEARADAELALSAAVLKYARHAQTGRLTPSGAHKLFDYDPKARDPKEVLTEIAASATPDKTLLALHPQSEQYQRLHTALIHARDSAKALGRDPENDRTVQLIAINMERWRWLPSDLGNFHVWNNIPEFKFRVLKDGRSIYEEKTIVGQVKYATPFFSAPMRNIVFNPNWTVPPTIVKEDIAPKLRGPQRSGGLFGGRESRNRMLARYGLTVSKGGKPVDADQVDWQSANVHAYTFQQDPGPHNVLGLFKFNFPNKHAIYMHDTTQKELFSRQIRTLSHGCIRVNQPTRFAAFLLAEDKGWTMGNVQNVFDRAQGQTKVIALSRNIPVHLTYNTAVADSQGSIREFGDVYGIDNRMAAKMFKKPAHFNVPFSSAEFAETSPSPQYSNQRPQRRRSANAVDDFLSGILGN
jgi:murein L,D-transpeptidase YcbB/YkuD